MVKNLILAGAGGCMKELVWQIQELNKTKNSWNILGYVDAVAPEGDKSCIVGRQEIPFLGTDKYLLEQEESVNVAVCTGNPALRKKIAEKLKQNEKLRFPNLILGNTKICDDVKLGQGCVISMDARISTNVQLGDFVFLNTGSMVCHDGQIGDFVTLSPAVWLAGNVSVGAGSEFGMGTKVIQGIRIGKNVITGAGSVVVNNIENNCTVVGVPARKIKG